MIPASDVGATAREGRISDVVRSVAAAIGEPMAAEHWVLVELGKSPRAPVGYFRGYRAPTASQESVVQRGPFRMTGPVPDHATFLSPPELEAMAPGVLAQIFPEGGLYLPLDLPFRVTLEAGPGAFALLGGQVPEPPDPTTLGLFSVALAAAVAVVIQAEIERDLSPAVIAKLRAAVEQADTRQDACEAVLRGLKALVPFEAGVLYLLDPDPGLNQYLVFGASVGESPEALFRSFHDHLGFTWQAAVDGRPRSGSESDVPDYATHANRSALSHIRGGRRYEAWALVPFLADGRTRAVAHVEGVRHFGGARVCDLERARQIGRHLGAALDRRLACLPESRGGLSLESIRNLREALTLEGHDRRVAFEAFVVSLLGDMEGFLTVRHEVHDLPQIDGLFLLEDASGRFVVEAKCADDPESSIGADAIRQLVGCIAGAKTRTGLLVTNGRVSSRIGSGVLPPGYSVVALQGNGLERLCVLPPAERRTAVASWLQAGPGFHMAAFPEGIA